MIPAPLPQQQILRRHRAQPPMVHVRLARARRREPRHRLAASTPQPPQRPRSTPTPTCPTRPTHLHLRRRQIQRQALPRPLAILPELQTPAATTSAVRAPAAAAALRRAVVRERQVQVRDVVHPAEPEPERAAVHAPRVRALQQLAQRRLGGRARRLAVAVAVPAAGGCGRGAARVQVERERARRRERCVCVLVMVLVLVLVRGQRGAMRMPVPMSVSVRVWVGRGGMRLRGERVLKAMLRRRHGQRPIMLLLRRRAAAPRARAHGRARWRVDDLVVRVLLPLVELALPSAAVQRRARGRRGRREADDLLEGLPREPDARRRVRVVVHRVRQRQRRHVTRVEPEPELERAAHVLVHRVALLNTGPAHRRRRGLAVVQRDRGQLELVDARQRRRVQLHRMQPRGRRLWRLVVLRLHARQPEPRAAEPEPEAVVRPLRLVRARAEDEVARVARVVREPAERARRARLGVGEGRVRVPDADLGRKVVAERGREEVVAVEHAVAKLRERERGRRRGGHAAKVGGRAARRGRVEARVAREPVGRAPGGLADHDHAARAAAGKGRVEEEVVRGGGRAGGVGARPGGMHGRVEGGPALGLGRVGHLGERLGRAGEEVAQRERVEGLQVHVVVHVDLVLHVDLGEHVHGRGHLLDELGRRGREREKAVLDVQRRLFLG